MADVREYRRQTGNYEDIRTADEWMAQGRYEWMMHRREGDALSMDMDIDEYADIQMSMADEEGEYDGISLPMESYARDNLDGTPFA